MTAGRLFRTLGSLHPLQIATRPARWVQARAFRRMPDIAPPAVLPEFRAAGPALRALVDAERERISLRLKRLPSGSLLEAYERRYGLDRERDRASAFRDWRDAVALHPYPASLRARSVAVGIRLGERGLEAELARACRAVLLQPELHLLGNHLLENALALVCGGAVSRGVEPELWWRVGCRLLEWQLPEQFLADGGHFERSVSYHIELTLGLLQAVELARQSRRSVPEPWLETLERALPWLAWLRAPGGQYPLFNDAAMDAAAGVDEVLALASELGFVVRSEPSRPWSHYLPDTGWLVACAEDGSWLAFDAGPDGASYQPGHVHADALGFELWVRGQRLVVDYGVGSYLAGAERDRTRATRSHSTVELAGLDSCEVWSAFRVGRRQNATVHSFARDAHGKLRITASHDGYRHLPGSPIHVRTLELQPGRLRVEDRIEGGPCVGVSRVRLDAERAKEARITTSAVLDRMDDVWHPSYSDPRPAVVLSQPVESGSPAVFDIEW